MPLSRLSAISRAPVAPSPSPSMSVPPRLTPSNLSSSLVPSSRRPVRRGATNTARSTGGSASASTSSSSGGTSADNSNTNHTRQTDKTNTQINGTQALQVNRDGSSMHANVVGSSSRSRSRDPRSLLHPAHQLSSFPSDRDPSLHVYPFAPPAPVSSSRTRSRSRSALSPARVGPPSLHTSRRYADGPRISKPLLESGYIQKEADRGNTLAEKYAALQEQHSRLSSPVRIPRESPSMMRSRPASRSRSPSKSPTKKPSSYPHHQHARSSSNVSSHFDPRLSSSSLDVAERALADAESAVNAPNPLLKSPSRAATPVTIAAWQSELTSLDREIRQNTQELLYMQQQQHLQTLQQQQAAMQQQMAQIQAQQQQQQQQQPPPISTSSWLRTASPVLRPSSPPSHPHSHSRSSSHSILSLPPAAVDPMPVPTPVVSRNNPFVSLVDAIDNVLAKSSAGVGGGGAGVGSAAFAHPPHTPQGNQQQQPWHTHQQPYTLYPSQTALPKTQIQILSETASSLSPPGSLNNSIVLGSIGTDPHHHAPHHMHQHHSTSYSSVPSVDVDPDLSDPRDVDMFSFDSHPELVSSGSIDSLRLANRLMREKGQLLLEKHSTLKGKFRAVRMMLAEYYRKKDREVAIWRMVEFVNRKDRVKKARALEKWKSLNQFIIHRDARRRAKLKVLLASSRLRSAHSTSLALHTAFWRWKEVAIRIAMRSIQNQWIADWEADIRFESRRTTLSQVLQRAQLREQQQYAHRRSKAFQQWRLLTIYSRVKSIFDSHSNSWSADRTAMLQLVLESNENRESIARAADIQTHQLETMKAQYAQLAHVATQNNELVQHISLLNNDITAIRHSAADARRRTQRQAASIIAKSVWNVRTNKLRRAWRVWARIIIPVGMPYTVPHPSNGGAWPAHSLHLLPIESHATSYHAQPTQSPQQQHRFQPSPTAAQPYYLPQGSPFNQLEHASATPYAHPTPNGSPLTLSSPTLSASVYHPGSLQQLASSPAAASMLSPRGPSAFDSALATVTDDEVDAKLQRFEQAKIQLEHETASLAARLHATRQQHTTTNMHNQTNTDDNTHEMTQFGRSTGNAHTQPHMPVAQDHTSTPQPMSVSVPAPLPMSAGPSSMQLQATRARADSVSGLEQYAPSASLIASGLEESFAVDQPQPQLSTSPSTHGVESNSYDAPDSSSLDSDPIVDGRLPAPTEEMIQPPLVFDDQIDPTPTPTNKTRQNVTTNGIGFFTIPPQPHASTHADTNATGHANGRIVGATAASAAIAPRPALLPAVAPSPSPVDPARVALLSSVFLEFSRAYSLRVRALAGIRFDSAAVDGRMAAADLSKAIRKAGLRAGDLHTAKITDQQVEEIIAQQQKGNTANTIDQHTFQNITNALLFSQ